MNKLNVHWKGITPCLTVLLGVTGAATVQAADKIVQDAEY